MEGRTNGNTWADIQNDRQIKERETDKPIISRTHRQVERQMDRDPLNSEANRHGERGLADRQMNRQKKR
jgi:hypothetical protein